MMTTLVPHGVFLPATSGLPTPHIWSCYLIALPKVFWPATSSLLTWHIWSSYLPHDDYFGATWGLLTSHKRSSYPHIWSCYLLALPKVFWPATSSLLTWHIWSSYLPHDDYFGATWGLLTCHKRSSYPPHMVLLPYSATKGLLTCNI